MTLCRFFYIPQLRENLLEIAQIIIDKVLSLPDESKAGKQRKKKSAGSRSLVLEDDDSAGETTGKRETKVGRVKGIQSLKDILPHFLSIVCHDIGYSLHSSSSFPFYSIEEDSSFENSFSSLMKSIFLPAEGSSTPSPFRSILPFLPPISRKHPDLAQVSAHSSSFFFITSCNCKNLAMSLFHLFCRA